MEQALAHLERHKVLDEQSNVYMVPLAEAVQAVVMSVDDQLEQVLLNLDNFTQTVAKDLQELQDD